MLTLANFNTTQAKTYYKRENYYSQEEAEANSEWLGLGASKHQLSGAIDNLDAYENIVNGLSPSGKTQLRQKQNHKDKKERAGVDLTFSAPKSVSLACLVGGDSRLEEAHRVAVKRTIDLIEERYAFTRINDERVKTGNLIVAVWHHDTSRELDPHLHSHCLLMNCTQSPDGKWRSLSNEEFFRNKILLGQIYRNELALECKKLGYEIEPHPKELFEIKGYTREQIEAFSKRHEQIKEKLAEVGLAETTENKIWAWRKTRVKKNHEIDRQEMFPYWHSEADLYGITHPIAASPNPQLAPLAPPEEIGAELVAAMQAGIEHCSERRVAFRSEDIEKFVTAKTRLFGISKLREAIAQHPELIKTFDGRYTTQAALTRELATIKLMQQGKRTRNPITHPEAVEHYLENKTLTQGQREAVTVAATTTDSFIAWQGVAGAGKTYALKELKRIASALKDVAPDHNIKGFAPSAEAAKVLEEELGIEANTVARLLVSKQPEEIHPNQIWIVDEAGLLSAKAAHELLQRATEERARVILVGDTQQLSAIEAGNPFKSLQQAGIQTAHLDESLRQKAPDLQKAVNLAAAGQVSNALSHLEQVGRIAEIVDVKERTTKIASEYIKLSPQERQNTLILAGTHKEQSSIVKEIRADLKQEGTLGYGVEATTLKALNLTSVQARYTHNYNKGDVVVPIREYRRSGLHKSQPYTVKAISQDKLTLSDLAGNQLTVDPMKFRKTVYKQETNEIAVGDRLRWTRNDKELGRRNGQEFIVTGIEGQTATIEYLDGLSDAIDLSQPLHCDYALVSTTYSSQGKTAERVLISSTVDGTVSQESVYVAISRAKHDLQIFAEDRKFLFEQAEESNVQETVLELLPTQPSAQAAQSAPARVKQEASLSVGVTEKPNLVRQEKSPTPNIEKLIQRSRIPHQVKLTERPQPKQKIKRSKPIERPKPLEAFWVPDKTAEAPPHIEEPHWRELVEGSAIHPAIITRNFRSLQMGSIEQEHEAWEYLMYSDKLERTNTGWLAGGMLNRYAHIEAGGWWCSAGVDARSFTDLQPGQKPVKQIWGCYKPDAPRENIDKPGKKIKYEHPPKTDLGIFLLDVPDDIAERIYQKAGVDPQQGDRANGFWYCVWKHDLPVTITEGAKKAACLLSQGHAAIGLPGIYAGYRSKDDLGNQIKAHLHEELAVFATPGREVRFCFDFETRPETKRNIEIAISRTGSLLQQQSAKVKVVSLPGPEKGVDDFIVANSPLAYERQNRVALELHQWRSVSKQQRQTVEPPKKLSIKERKERLKDKPDLQQLINNQKLVKPEEQTYDGYSQQLETEPTAGGRESDSESHSTINPKDGAVRNHKYSTEQHNRAVEVKPRATEREDYASGSQPDRESERTESQLHRLFEAISGYLELQEVEQQLGDDIERISRSRAGQYLRGEGTERIARAPKRQNSASLDSAASDGSIERESGDPEQRATRQLLSAISDHLEAAALEESPVAHNLQTLAEFLSRSQHQEFNKEAKNGDLSFLATDQVTPNQAVEAIATYVEQQQVLASAIPQHLETLTEQLLQLQAKTVPVSNQQVDLTIGDSLEQDKQPLTGQLLEAIADYVETQTIESAPLAQNLEALLRQWQHRSQVNVESVQQLETANADSLAQAEVTVLELKKLGLQARQTLEALADYVELEAAEVALVQPLETLIEGLHQRQEGVNKGQKNNPCLYAIVEYIEQEAVELEILPVLENVLAELSTLQKGKSLPLVSTSPEPKIFEQATKSITNYVEQTAVESELTEVLEKLAEELTLLQPEISTPVEQLDSTISNLLQQLKAISVKEQQILSTHAVEALANYVELEAVENALNPQVLQTLSNQMSQGGDLELSAAIHQLETIVGNYQTQVQALTLAQAVGAIADYCEREAISEAISVDVEQLTQNLSLSSESQLSNRLAQLSESIEQFGKLMKAQQTINPPVINSAPRKSSINIPRVKQDQLEAFKVLTNSVRDIPLEEVAERLGLERALHDKHKWRGEGQIISINDQKFYDHASLKGGYGAIDLVIHVQGQSFKDAINWLSNGTSYLPAVPSVRLPQPTAQERQPFQPPTPDEHKWQEVRQYLVHERGLPGQLVDELHSSGKISAAGLEPTALEKLRSKGYAHPENITNAVFLRQDLEQKPTGASLRGVSDHSQFKGLSTGSHRDNGWFSFIQGEGQLERIVLAESAIDALSAAALAKHARKTIYLSTDGAGSVPAGWLRQQQAQGIQIIAAHDADRPGEEMAWRLAAEVGAISRATPTRGKDWNEQLKSDRQPNQVEILPDPGEWQRVAQAIGKPETYIERIKAVTEAGKALPEQANSAMQQDFQSYRQTNTDLWQWHKAARTLGESEAYLKRIADVAIAFHHPKQPIPLPEKALEAMQQDQQKLTYRLRYQELAVRVRQSPKFKNSSIKDVDIGVAMIALKESPNQHGVGRVIAQSDQLKVWKQVMPEQEFKLKAKDYIHGVCNQAHDLRQDLLNQRVKVSQKRGRAAELEL
jgi:conjugative relaxase-like TrwC/TraI family protein